MKKLGLFILTSLLAFGLAACGGSEEKAKTNEDNQDSGTEEAVEATALSGEAEFTLTATNWEFATDKDLVVKKGTKVTINLVNEEGVHTVGNEDLGINLTADAPVEFTADTVGEYELICSTICGALEDHEGMKVTLKVVE